MDKHRKPRGEGVGKGGCLSRGTLSLQGRVGECDYLCVAGRDKKKKKCSTERAER